MGVHPLSSLFFLRVHSWHFRLPFLTCQTQIKACWQHGKLSFHDKEALWYIIPPPLSRGRKDKEDFLWGYSSYLTQETLQSLFSSPGRSTLIENPVLDAEQLYLAPKKGLSGRKAESRTCYRGSWEASWYLWGRRNKPLMGMWSGRTWKETSTSFFFFSVCLALQGSTHLGLISLLFWTKMENPHSPFSSQLCWVSEHNLVRLENLLHLLPQCNRWLPVSLSDLTENWDGVSGQRWLWEGHPSEWVSAYAGQGGE